MTYPSPQTTGLPLYEIVKEYADRWAFLVKNLDMRLPEGYGT